jgi:hypothetical protein
MNPIKELSTLGREPPDSTTKHPQGYPKARGPLAAVKSLPAGPETAPQGSRISPARKNPLEAGRQRIFPDLVISGYPPVGVLADPASYPGSVGANGTPWNVDGGEPVVTKMGSGNERLPLEVAHKRPLGGLLMTRRRPRVDNPSRTRHSVRKDSGR